MGFIENWLRDTIHQTFEDWNVRSKGCWENEFWTEYGVSNVLAYYALPSPQILVDLYLFSKILLTSNIIRVW